MLVHMAIDLVTIAYRHLINNVVMVYYHCYQVATGLMILQLNQIGTGPKNRTPGVTAAGWMSFPLPDKMA